MFCGLCCGGGEAEATRRPRSRAGLLLLRRWRFEVNFLLCSASWVLILVARRGEKLHLASRALSWLETGENAAALQHISS